jgi:MFS family permease
MEAKQTVRLYYVLSSVTGFGASFFFATYVMFLQAHHLNLLQVNLVNFCFFATIFLFEIPTGAIADIFGRKPSYVISCFLLGLSFLMYAFASNFIGFVLAEVVGAVAITFCSGAFEAWLVDRLKTYQEQVDLAPIMVRENQLNRAASLIGAMTGAWLSDLDMRIPWIVAGLMQFLVGATALLLMKEENFQRQKFSFCAGWKSMKKTIGISFQYGLNNKAVRFVLLTGVLQAFAIQAPNMQWQPFFARYLGQRTTPLGLIFAGISLALIIGSHFTVRFRKYCRSDKKAMALAQLGIGLTLVVTAYMWSLPLALSCFLLHEAVRGVFYPIKDTYLNNNIPSSERATLISFESMSRQIGGMAGLLISGVLANFISISFAWTVTGSLLFFATLWLMKNGKT